MKIVKVLLAIVCVMLGASFAHGSELRPGEGVVVQPARCTWTSGFFQEAVARRGLEELGYVVKKPKDLANPIAYTSIYFGDVDYWCNGNIPLHYPQMPKNFFDKATSLDPIVKAGIVQGYLVSKAAADELNIKSLNDFKRPEVIAAFDKNDDGKADLVACPAGWGCEKIIAGHMEENDLNGSINQIKAAYEASMAGALGEFKSGEPIFFYGWTPNWTMFKLKPGEDVVWINVPSQDPEAQSVEDYKGAVTSPWKPGCPVQDITVVANNEFLEANPSAKVFLETFKLTSDEIAEQNNRMNEGEKSDDDIDRHVDEWIAKNKSKWDAWLAKARAAK